MTEPWEKRQAQFTRLMDRINALPSIREATVTTASPLRVTFDTDTASTLVYATTTPGLVAGDRVLTVRLRRYVWVLGKRI